jgi:enoyl-CoA hydratase/carnithine racemase
MPASSLAFKAFGSCRVHAPATLLAPSFTGFNPPARRFSANAEEAKLLKTEIVDGVALVTMLAPDEKFPWGTRVFEHRINKLLLQELNAAMDAAEEGEAQALVVVGEGRFFCNGMDLQYIAANVQESTAIQTAAENTLSRLLTLGIPTVAALNGHWTAAGAMLGLAFDVRVMPSDGKGLFFVPGIDIGLVYSAGMTELMKAKMPQPIWNEVLCFGKRYQCDSLLQHGVVNAAPVTAELLPKAMEIATELKSKGKDAKTRETMRGIKANLYKDAIAALGRDVEDMGFASGTFDSTGRAAK